MNSGDLHRMFERIVATAPGNQTSTEDLKVAVPDGMPPYTVTIHGRPGVEDGDMDSPWVITLDNFLTDEECDRLVELGHEAKYEQSLDVGEENFDGSFDGKKSQRRTSKNAWCSKSLLELFFPEYVLFSSEAPALVYLPQSGVQLNPSVDASN